jgi:hypothetical protein
LRLSPQDEDLLPRFPDLRPQKLGGWVVWVAERRAMSDEISTARMMLVFSTGLRLLGIFHL